MKKPKANEKTVATKAADTAITQVVAKVVGKNLATAAADSPAIVNETNPDYSAAIEKVRAAMADYGRSVWQLAWALVDFRSIHERLHPRDRLSDKQLANLLGITLSPARIGQLVNTAVAFPREHVDESIDFRVYEQARVFTEKQPRMTAEKRLELVKKHPTTAAIAKIKPAVRNNSTLGQALIIRVTPVTGDDEDCVVRIGFNRTSIELPNELQNSLRQYAIKLFAKDKATD